MNRSANKERVARRIFESVPRYVWQETLGSGGMGIVFKVLDVELGESVALKVLLPDSEPEDDECLERFRREVSLGRQVRHPNIARVHSLGNAGGLSFLTMELIHGRTLADLLAAAGRLAPAAVVDYLGQVALGVGSAHETGIVHRDLKPQNIMVDDQGKVTVLDFGLAHRPTLAPLTSALSFIGTPRYMAPEQTTGGKVDPRADVYALGVIAFELLTGKVPFQGSTPWDTARMHVVEPVPSNRLEEARVPPPLAALVLECLCKSAPDRPASGNALALRLTRIGMNDPACL
ncbi:MAG: serine/threonine protein kinase [Holophagales bacterium]|nr:serine/threonine protein kinase [Holophagales bacterium]MBK9967377.1 serine/threonine protein kinase [Holophagales bacterium]